MDASLILDKILLSVDFSDKGTIFSISDNLEEIERLIDIIDKER